jgi:3-phenylpropionate/trans-cinnamate dioxygenase ferredoxin component
VADFVTVARVDELPPGTVRNVRAGEDEFALANVAGDFYAVQPACLHLHGPLGEGCLQGQWLHCPWHGWTYDVRTGLNDFDHTIQLETFEVRVEGDEVQVRRS